MVFGWLINLLKSIFGFGSKDAGTLENKESESEIRKAKLRIEEDKERLKQAKTEKKERGNERKEVKEIGEILGGENLGDDLRKIKELIAQDEKILRELRQDEIEASRIEAIGIRIEREDQEEIRDESQIGAGQSPRAAGDQQDIQIQQGEIRLEEGRKKVDSELIGLYEQKLWDEEELFRILNKRISLSPHIQGDERGYIGERLQQERMRYNALNEEKQRILESLRELTQQILTLEHSKAE